MEKKLTTLVENSGILTQLKTIDCLKKHDWGVSISPYYYDNVADLVKEIDIVAEKQFNSTGHARHSSVQVNIQLFIECKYINREVVFWFDELNRDKAFEKVEENTGLRIANIQRGMGGDISSEVFHYLNSAKAAKIFSANSSNEDLIYKGTSQALRAQVYYQHRFPNPIIFPFNDRSETKHQIVRYPVVVCDNFQNLHEVEATQDGFFTKPIKDSFLFETNYVYFNVNKTSTKDDYFIIDMVNTETMEEFLKKIEKEAASIRTSLSTKQDMQRNHNN